MYPKPGLYILLTLTASVAAEPLKSRSYGDAAALTREPAFNPWLRVDPTAIFAPIATATTPSTAHVTKYPYELEHCATVMDPISGHPKYCKCENWDGRLPLLINGGNRCAYTELQNPPEEVRGPKGRGGSVQTTSTGCSTGPGLFALVVAISTLVGGML